MSHPDAIFIPGFDSPAKLIFQEFMESTKHFPSRGNRIRLEFFWFFCSFRVKFMRLTKQQSPRPGAIALR
jgi:hypothetical protein